MLTCMHICDISLNFISRTFPMISRHVEWRNVPEFYRENRGFFLYTQQFPTLSDCGTLICPTGKTEVKSKLWLEMRSFSASILFFFFSSLKSSLLSVLCSGWTPDSAQLMRNEKQSLCCLWCIVCTGQLVEERKLNSQLQGSSHPQGPPFMVT